MIVLPMAGLSNRFFKAGYKVPKYMLDLHGSPVFDFAIGSFANLFGKENFLIICRDVFDTPKFVEERCLAMGLSRDSVDVIVLDHETSGQAETVAEGLRLASTPGGIPVTIFNVDTFRPGFTFPDSFDMGAIDGYLEVFHAPGEHWSFVRPEEGTDRVLEVTEKVRISDLCSNGLYHFRTVGFYMSLFTEIEKEMPSKLQGGEYYVAPLYNIAIERNSDIRYKLIPLEEMHFCGTPSEYEILKNGRPFSPASGPQ